MRNIAAARPEVFLLDADALEQDTRTRRIAEQQLLVEAVVHEDEVVDGIRKVDV